MMAGTGNTRGHWLLSRECVFNSNSDRFIIFFMSAHFVLIWVWCCHVALYCCVNQTPDPRAHLCHLYGVKQACCTNLKVNVKHTIIVLSLFVLSLECVLRVLCLICFAVPLFCS